MSRSVVDDDPQSTSDATAKAAFITAAIVGFAFGPIPAAKAHRALPALLDRLALLPYLPGLIWHSVRLVLSEPTEQRRGERR